MEMDTSDYFIDTSPTVRNDMDVPKYTVERKSTELAQLEEKNTAQKPRQFQNPCWNCGRQTHSIRDCDVQSNSYTLEWNKEIQMWNKNHQMRKFQKQAGRYHDSDKLSEHHTCTIPKPLSHRLRKIMGLTEYDLPSYIYRLRTHGYPAAWLKYATVKPSGINLYDKDGNEVADPNAEEGEIVEEDDKIRYDLSKLIQFPGFNAPMPPNCIDDFEKFKAPPYDSNQSLEHMITELKEKAVTEYVLQKNLNAHENVSEEESITSPTPSEKLTDIPPTDVDSSSNEISQDSLPESIDCSVTITEKCSLGRILSSTEGTPLLRSKSGHTRLPPRENFSKDVCDVINFENLPESTGKFERLRGLLKKVKSALGLKHKST